MRIILILGFVGLACFFGFKAFDRIIYPKDPAPSKVESPVVAVAPVEPAVPIPALPPAPEVPPMIALPEVRQPEVIPQTVLVYVFKNRPVPPPPFGRAERTVGPGKDADGLELSVDVGSNSWIMRGPPEVVSQVKNIGQYLDVMQDELDLDFLLLTVSESWLRNFGISAAYQEGASWLPTFALSGTGSTLRIASNGFAIDLSGSLSDSSASVYSSPVVRVVTGEPWEFGSDREIPVQSTIRQDGLQQNSYDYRQVGLGFSGSLTKAGPLGTYRLQVEQRNGDTETTDIATDQPPVIRSQILKTSLVVEVGKWSCVGGVSTWRKETKKRVLGRHDSEEQNLLLVFVRPRDALEVPPQAYPVGDGPEHLDPLTDRAWDLDADDNPLLPPADWLDRRINRSLKKVKESVIERRPVPAAKIKGHPAGK